MENKDYVTFEVAKILKEKGYNEPVKSFYCSDGQFSKGIFTLQNDSRHFCYSAPTLWDTLKWLREKHEIMVDINSDYYDGFIFSSQVWSLGEVTDEHGFDTYEEALNEGIKEALKLIK